MPLHPKDTALSEALRLDYAAASPAVDRHLGGIVLDALAGAAQPLTACVLVFHSASLPAGTYSVDCAGFLVLVQPPPPTRLDADVAVMLGGPATASPAGLRQLAVAAGAVSQRLALRLAGAFAHVRCDDDTIAWPLAIVNTSLAHLTTVTGKDLR